MDNHDLLIEGLNGIDALGIDAIPESDFYSFLGDISGELLEPSSLLPASSIEVATTLRDAQLEPVQGVPDAAAVPTQWQVATTCDVQQAYSRGSPCSSAASVEHTNCPDSPMVNSPVSSIDATQTLLTGTSGRDTSTGTRRRVQLQQSSPSAAAESDLQQSPGQEFQQQQPALTRIQLAAAKRRAPVVDWRAIDDPEERRKQRRLAKNRVTAARSRERKKEQMVEMEARLSDLEAENNGLRAMLQSMMTENTSLKEQLASLTRGAAAASDAQECNPKPAVLVKCLAIMHLVCCLLLCTEASLRLVVPLLSVLLQQGASARPSVGQCAAALPAGGVQEWCSSGKPRPVPEWWRVRLRTEVLTPG